MTDEQGLVSPGMSLEYESDRDAFYIIVLFEDGLEVHVRLTQSMLDKAKSLALNGGAKGDTRH